MNDSNLYAALNPNVVMVGVRYLGQPGFANHPEQGRVEVKAKSNGPYTYKALVEQGIKVGDHVVVDSRGTLCVAVVEYVEHGRKLDPGIKYKWVVQAIDYTLHNKAVESEKKFTEAVVEMEREKKRESLRLELESRLGADRVKELTADFTPRLG